MNMMDGTVILMFLYGVGVYAYYGSFNYDEGMTNRAVKRWRKRNKVWRR